jgi:F-type H+-transporting ATPase subunit a
MQGPQVMFTIGGIPITETVTTTWLIMAALVIVSIIITKRLEMVPKGKQNIAEIIVEGVVWLVDSTMGPGNHKFIPYIGTLVLYLLFANLIGLIGLRPPTADLNTTLALSSITFFCIHFFGMKSQGVLPYLKGFTEPMFFLLPLNIIGELATPFSLAFRLFGNILGGTIIMALLYSFAPILVPILPHMYFDIFAGVIQTFIFAMLTMTFISIAQGS